MAEKIEVKPESIGGRNLVALIVYGIIFTLTSFWSVLYVVGLISFLPFSWVYWVAYGPVLVYLFICYLQESIYEATKDATKDALKEFLDEMEDQIVGPEDVQRIEELLEADPKGNA